MNEPIRRRVLSSLVVGLGLLAILAVGGVGLVAASHQTVADQTATIDGLSAGRRLLIQAISLQETAVLDYELTRSQRALDEFTAAELDSDVEASRLIDLAGDDPRLTGAADKVIALGAAWRDEWARPLIALLEVGRTPPVSGPYTQPEGERRFAAVEAAFDDLDGAILQRRAEAAAGQTADANRLVVIIGGACAAFGAALLLLGIWLLRTVSGPLAASAPRPRVWWLAGRSASEPSAMTRSARLPTFSSGNASTPSVATPPRCRRPNAQRHTTSWRTSSRSP